MPLPLAPIALFALRGSAVAASVWAIRRGLRAISHAGRTDQRAEDAFDDLGEGLSAHQPADRAEDAQHNGAARFRRVIRWGDKTIELDAALMTRLRIRRK